MFEKITLKKAIQITVETETKFWQAAAEKINTQAGETGFATAFNEKELEQYKAWLHEQIAEIKHDGKLEISETEIFLCVECKSNFWQAAAEKINTQAGEKGFATAFNEKELEQYKAWFHEQIAEIKHDGKLEISETEIFLDEEGNLWDKKY